MTARHLMLTIDGYTTCSDACWCQNPSAEPILKAGPLWKYSWGDGLTICTNGDACPAKAPQ